MMSIFEQTGGTYRQERDVLLPNLDLPEASAEPIGKYGRQRKRFLEEHHPGRFAALVLSSKLYPELAETEKTCREQMELLCRAIAEQEGVTEALKAADQMEWVRRCTGVKHR